MATTIQVSDETWRQINRRKQSGDTFDDVVSGLLRGNATDNTQNPEQEKMSVPEEILDATCGGRSIWLHENKDNDQTLFVDMREEEPGFHGQHGRTYAVQPDEVADFRDLDYPNETFNLCVFDPPHLTRENGMKQLSGYIIKKYGALRAETWQADLEAGFSELWRVLKPGGVLVFKFADNHIDFRDVIELAPTAPLFGTTTKKNSKVETRWFVFYKPDAENDREPEGSK